MSIAWLNTTAFIGFALVALPIAIHLLVRQQTRVVAFPSLRFLSQTALAAFRRRAIQDALLLACRIAIVSLAVLALAGPIVQTASRTAGQANRVSRAVVPLEGTAQTVEHSEGAFRSATFARENIADALTDAVRWLDDQPPSAREIVVTGTFRRGQIEQSDLLGVPRDIGLRLVQAPPAQAANSATLSTLMRSNGRLIRVDHVMQLGADSTRVSSGITVQIPEDRIRVIAAAKDQTLANAALDAALRAGLRWTTADRRLMVIWEGAEDAARPSSGIEIVRMAVPTPPETAATAIWNAIDQSTPRETVEPVTLSRNELELWSRKPGPPSPSAVPADEGDRRWLWAAALALLALEQLLIRERAVAQSAGSAPAEVRVA
jgi:hypothetical protein